jgi:hypothetical protein
MKHNYQTEYLSGIDANNPATFPDTGKTHPVDTIEPDDDQSDYHRGVEVGMRALQRSLEWIWFSSTHSQRHSRLIGLFYNLNMEYLINELPVEHVAYQEGINRQYLFRVISETQQITTEHPGRPKYHIPQPVDGTHTPHMITEEHDPDQMDLFNQ